MSATNESRPPQCLFRCDGCGKQEAGSSNRHGYWFKPHEWFQRTDDEGTQLACSRKCIDAIAEASGKTSVVLPI
jgi:hypothetical protein